MRAREFITEQLEHLAPLDAGQANPLQHTYILPGIRNNDPYHALRFGVAIARARADLGDATEGFPDYQQFSSFGQNAIVAGFNDNVEQVIDKALELSGMPGGKQLVGTKTSQEPKSTQKISPIRPFQGYRR